MATVLVTPVPEVVVELAQAAVQTPPVGDGTPGELLPQWTDGVTHRGAL